MWKFFPFIYKRKNNVKLKFVFRSPHCNFFKLWNYAIIKILNSSRLSIKFQQQEALADYIRGKR